MEDTEKIEKVEKKENKAYFIGAFIGGVIGFLVQGGGLGCLAGAFVGAFLGILFLRIFADKDTKDALAVKDAFVNKYHKENQFLPNIECPTCHAKTVMKISTGKKAAYVLGFGILAPAFKKVRSQFECKGCGYKW